MRRLEPLRQLFALDLRSLALFRIALGGVSLLDLWRRWPDAAAFISDAGFLPRTEMIDHLSRPWSISFHLIWGEPWQMQLLLLLHAAAVVGMLVGWKTRACTAVVWVFTASLINRNALMVNGGDTLLSLLYFWGIFLPLGARWSLDAVQARKRSAQTSLPHSQWCDTGSVGFILQIAVVYWTTILLKTDPVWWNGTALHYVFHNDLIMRPLAYELRAYPSLLVALTWGTVVIEALGPLLLFIPWKKHIWRLLAIIAFGSLHLGIELLMRVELFSFASLTAWIAILPGAFWDWPGWKRFWKRPEAISQNPRPAAPLGPISRWITIVSMATILIWISRKGLPESYERKIYHDLIGPMRMVQLRQSWKMFAPRPRVSDGWYILRGRLANGSEIDLLRQGATLSWEKPECPACTYPSRRWVEYIHRVGTASYRPLRPSFGNYFVRTWNAQHDVGYQVVEAELYYMREEISLDGETAPEKVRIWSRRDIPPTLR
jgi:hypothetical protein